MSRPSPTTLRNIAILIAIALAVDLLPGGGRAATVFGGLLQLLFVGGLAFLGYRLYRENRVALYSLGDQTRGVLYGSVVLTVLAFAATARLWGSGAGVAVWFLLLGLAVAGFLHVMRVARS